MDSILPPSDIAVAAKASSSARLPILSLLALATAAFISILTEALPAGLLPQICADLNISAPLAGQLVTLYAIGSVIAAIPLTALTRSWNRRTVLLIAVGGFFLFNTTTALSVSFPLTLAARFCAGVFAGLLWAVVAGYASRLAPEHLRGRAIAIAMVGIPLALSLGIPLGTVLGHALGWRCTFGVMSVMTLVLLVWIRMGVRDFPGHDDDAPHLPMSKVLAMPGVKAVIFSTLTFAMSHNVLYTYIAPFLTSAGMGESVQSALFVFGFTALAGIFVVGALIHLWLRELVIASVALFSLAAVAMVVWNHSPAVIYPAIAIWGLIFGGAATLFQDASAHAARKGADVAQSILVTAWNTAIAGGGLVGGILLNTLGAHAFPVALLVLLIPTLFVVVSSKAGFPSRRQLDN